MTPEPHTPTPLAEHWKGESKIQIKKWGEITKEVKRFKLVDSKALQALWAPPNMFSCGTFFHLFKTEESQQSPTVITAAPVTLSRGIFWPVDYVGIPLHCCVQNAWGAASSPHATSDQHRLHWDMLAALVNWEMKKEYS